MGKSIKEAITFELGLFNKEWSLLNRWRWGKKKLYQAKGRVIAKAIFNHCSIGMGSYLFHHSALAEQTNTFSWNKLIYFEIGFIRATNKAKECLQELLLDIGK